MKTRVTTGWADYALLQAGDGQRLERFGTFLIARQDPSVLWPLSIPRPEWNKAQAVFQDGKWQRSTVPDSWKITWESAVFTLKLTPFRHLGIFPEQVSNWIWLREIIEKAVKNGKKPRVLNLFGYTGAASIVAAQAGAEVCHVDASKGTVYWASENAKQSGLSNQVIRWIVDDARKFVAREIKRGQRYDIILLDPPVFGRGSKGEVWRLHDDLAPLMRSVAQILSEAPLGFLLNFYATEIYPESVFRLVQEAVPTMKLELNSLCLEEEDGKNRLQTGYVIHS